MKTISAATAAVLLVAPMAQGAKWPLRAPHRGDVPASFDCSMRKAAYEFGKKTLPRLGKFEPLYYALDLNSEDCKVDLEHTENVNPAPVSTLKRKVPDSAIYVAVDGDDVSASGTKSSPFKTIQAAADHAARAGSKTVILRDGTHYLSEAVELGPQHSGIEFRALEGEAPVVSGGKQLNVQWKPFQAKNATYNIWVADVGDQVDEVPGLQLDGVRATRARYPNIPGGLETSCGYGCMISGSSAQWTPPQFDKFGEVTFYTDNTTAHDRPNGQWFENYMVGRNGLCSVYDPPVSYWCSEHPSGGGAFAFRTPSGVTPKAGVLPNAPYADVSEAVFFVWRPARWANWMFEISNYDKSTGNFTFGKGGNQGARGENSGGDFFVENVMEELDYPGEFFFDKKMGKLYLYHNGTGAPPASTVVVAPQIRTLVNITGTQWNPARGIKHSGITYKAARYTYMDPHGVPSAGDWALDRVGAVFLQGTEDVVFDECEYARCFS